MAARPAHSKTRRAKPLYRSSKISEYKFKRVLWSFVLDEPVAHAASHIALSANSINAIYAKLRKFFFAYGLFRDPYRGRDPREGFDVENVEDAEYYMLRYHLGRVASKRNRLDAPLNGPDFHFAESCWRFDFSMLEVERGPHLVQRLMYQNLMEFIRRFGPVGAKSEPSPQERREGVRLAMEQLDRLVLWLERNSVKFRDPGEKAQLRALREPD